MITKTTKARGAAATSDNADPIAEGDAARDRQDWDIAADAYGRAVELSPDNAAIWVQLGHALKESGRKAEAEAAYRRAVALEPEQADPQLQLGHLLKITGRLKDAAAAYLRSLELDPDNSDALWELDGLSDKDVPVPEAAVEAALRRAGGGRRPGEPEPDERSVDRARRAIEEILTAGGLETAASNTLAAALKALAELESAGPAMAASAAAPLVFDVSDLFSYFRNARLPTGIQRVQIETIGALLRRPGAGASIQVCAFSEHRDEWVRIPESFFLRLCRLALSSGDPRERDWVLMTHQLRVMMRAAAGMDFAPRSVLINLGTSWWLQNYFLQVRRAKAERDIIYVPFVHDLIPVLFPEYCVRELTQDFISWVLGAFQHADHFLVNSQATRRDLLAVAAELGHQLPEDRVTVVSLNADFRKPVTASAPPDRLSTWGLRKGAFVLFVSTIEARKNHLGAFNAWLALTRKHGPANTPKLVCVGNDGWLNDAVHASLEASDMLRAQVLMLSRLSDAELALLYESCLFTFYPSHYEGWGLPVTESLCHGKVPLASTASSLPEAGGDFADYFELGSDAAALAALERLIFDHAHRQARQRHIVEAYRPRGWDEIGAQIQSAVSAIAAASPSAEDQSRRAVMAAELGVYYPIRRNLQLHIWKGAQAGEMFRAGRGWSWPDDWGVWTRPEGGEIALRLPGPHRRLRGYFGLQGIRDDDCEWTLAFGSPSGARDLAGKLGPNEEKWVSFELPASPGETLVRARLHGAAAQNLADVTDGLDHRSTSVGFRGFYFCEEDDILARTAFVEALALRDLARLEPGG